MRWDAVIAAVTGTALADPIIVGIIGAAGRLAGTGPHQVSLLEWSLIADTEDELWAPCTVQWDLWVNTIEEQIALERQLRRLFHAELPVNLAGVRMWSQYVDGSVLASPDRDGYYGRALRFRYTPLRDLYAGTP